MTSAELRVNALALLNTSNEGKCLAVAHELKSHVADEVAATGGDSRA